MTDKKKWIKLREHVLDLVMIYHQVESYKSFKNASRVSNYFVLSRKYLLRAFFIKLRSILGSGKSTFNVDIKNEELIKIISPIFEEIREINNSNDKSSIWHYTDKTIAHNISDDLTTDFSSVDKIYSNIIKLSKKIDVYYDDIYCYDEIHGADGIQIFDYYIENSNKFENMRDLLLNKESKISTFKLDIHGDVNAIIDFLFIQLYIKKKYNKKVEDYFNIRKMSVSGWRKSNKVPTKRLTEFYDKEGTLDILELFKKLYK